MTLSGASIPMGQGGHVPPQYLLRGGTSIVMSPQYLEVMSFRMSTRVTATAVCCILMQILCVVSQKSLSFWGTPYRGYTSGPHWGTSVPQSSFIIPQ